MFTGIIQGIGSIKYLKKNEGIIHYAVQLTDSMLENIKLGSSIAIDGVCQTVIKVEKSMVYFDAIQETLEKTTLSSLVLEQSVNVERSAKFGDEIGGHILSGHIIGKATLKAIVSPDVNNRTFHLSCPPAWMSSIFEKGFIALDGASLTVGTCSSDGCFTVHLIPETLRRTVFSTKKIGSHFNIELDSFTNAVVKTVERVLLQMNLSKEH